MATPIDSLVLDLVEWVAGTPRPYGEVIEAWRTSCPRLTVWEDALEGGLIACEPSGSGALLVVATPKGRALLARRRAESPSVGFASRSA